MLFRSLGESFEFIGNREYRDGDSIRDIDWRATARLSRAIVREYREEYFMRVAVILDIKTPGSGEVEKTLWDNLQHLKPKDEVKFVLCGRSDYDWAKQVLTERELDKRCSVLFSPVYHQVNPTELAEWILQDKLPVRMQVQLHKILWGEVAGK